eukprot:8152873-Alexandrium_andersonii.AAC.1
MVRAAHAWAHVLRCSSDALTVGHTSVTHSSEARVGVPLLHGKADNHIRICLLYTSPSPRD